MEELERSAGFSHDDRPVHKLDKLDKLLALLGDAVKESAALLAALLSIPSNGRYPPLKLNPMMQRERTLQVLYSYMIALAHQQPLLVYVEDAHWIDPSSLEILHRVVTQVGHLPVLVAISYRPEFQPQWLNQAHVSRIVLSRLDAQQVRAMISSLSNGNVLSEAYLQQIISKADGVPLFVEELTKAVLESDSLDSESAQETLTVPSTLKDSLMARIDRVASVKQVAQIGAAIGREFSYELLNAVSRLPKEVLSTALQKLIAAEIIFRTEVEPMRFTFKHALVRDAAYESLLRSQRKQLHMRIAELLEQHYPTIVATEPEQLAYHYTGAESRTKAIEYWLKAGQRWLERSSHTEALTHLLKGLELVAELQCGPERDQQELQLQTVRARVLSATKGFASPEVGRVYTRAHELCHRLHDNPLIAPVLNGIFVFHLNRADYAKAVGVAYDCLYMAQQQNSNEFLMSAHCALGSSICLTGHLRDAVEHLQKSLDLYDPQHHAISATSYASTDFKTRCLGYLAYTQLALGYPDQALATATRGLEYAHQLGNPHNLCLAMLWYCITQIQRRDYISAQDQALQLLQLAEEQQFPFWIGLANCYHGWASISLGALQAGMASSQQGLLVWRKAGTRLMLSKLLGGLADALGNAGEVPLALDLVEKALSFAKRLGEHESQSELYRIRGTLLLSQVAHNHSTQAEDSFNQALNIAREHGAKLWELRAATSLSQLWCDQGQYERAYQLLHPVYTWFSEGLDIVDLRQAKKQLDEIR